MMQITNQGTFEDYHTFKINILRCSSKAFRHADEIRRAVSVVADSVCGILFLCSDWVGHCQGHGLSLLGSV